MQDAEKGKASSAKAAENMDYVHAGRKGERQRPIVASRNATDVMGLVIAVRASKTPVRLL